MSPTTIDSTTPAALIAELTERLVPNQPSVLAFDADGTLWSGDVGDDIFRFAVAHGRLREAARVGLEREAKKRGFSVFADVNQTAQHLFEMYMAGRYVEREMCELMTWCYAGHTLTELRALVQEALDSVKHGERLHPEVGPLLEFARKSGIRTVVISASPRPTVEVASRYWGFSPADIAAATPLVENEVVLPEMNGIVPYADAKVVAGRALIGSARWLAAFGDNVFDIEMMQTAELALAVRPKPKLTARWAEVPGIRVLSTNL
jgi:phosphoserine phosphatase